MPKFTLMVQGEKLVNGELVLESAPPPVGEMPIPVTPPDGIEYGTLTVGRFGRIWDDAYLYGESRTKDKPIQFTNMIQPGLELFYKDGRLRVKGKPAVNVRGTLWWEWMRTLMGDVVLERFTRDGYGILPNGQRVDFMDNGPDTLYGLYCGCNLVRELDTLNQGGLTYSLLEAMDFDGPLDFSLTPRNAPHLFMTQVLVASTASRDYNILCDRGAIGGNGRVQWPNAIHNKVPGVTSVPLAGMEQYKIAFFPRPPFDVRLFRESLVVDNVWRVPDANEGVDVTIERLLFNGGDVYGMVSGLWYPLDIMLVRGTYDLPAFGGDMDDRRVFVSPWKFPPGVPDIGWTYKHYPPDYPWPGLLARLMRWLLA